MRHGRYTAGTTTRYRPSILTADDRYQKLATGFHIGVRFHSAPVIRFADAKPMHLGHVIKADGRWRIFAFCGREDATASSAPIAALCDFLAHSPISPVLGHTPREADIDSAIDVRAVFQQSHRQFERLDLPPFLIPQKGRYGLRDYEKMFCIDPRAGDIYAMRGVDRDRGCILVVRPDHFIAMVLPLDAHEQLAQFLAGVLLPQ